MDSLTIKQLATHLEQLGFLSSQSSVTSENAPGDSAIFGAAHDSRAVFPGNVFICKGVAFRPAFLTSALEKGAVAYVCEEGLASQLAETAPGVPALVVTDIRSAMPHIASFCWGRPEDRLKIVGVTGSKGKTTTTYMLRSILDGGVPGSRAALLGSVEFYDGVESGMSPNTTPEAPELWHRLANAADCGLTMVMEVSSQGLKYGRVEGLTFDIAAVTNIGRDHVSPVEHPTLEDYISSKLHIFDVCGKAVVGLSTEHLDRILKAAEKVEELRTFGAPESGADYWATDITPGEGGTTFTAHTPEWTAELRLGIPGLFNVDNALCAIALAQMLGASYEQIRAGLLVTRVPGRMESVPSATGDIIGIVDFAHNGQSFQKFFESVSQEYPTRRIITVFGCTGVKGLERRTQMPPVACAFSDLCIYTEDDPGAEPLQQIFDGMLAATPEGANVELVNDRVEAIRHAVEVADAWSQEGFQSIICVLGKGEEVRMLRAHGPEPCDEDKVIVERMIRERDARKGC